LSCRIATLFVFGHTLHTLERRYLKLGGASESRVDAVVHAVLAIHKELPIVPGKGNGILVFLPGWAEIEGVEDALQAPK
jgi:HrpA-like RNA helicase